MKRKKTFLGLALVLLLALPLVRPYFQPGFFSTHDGEWAVIRLGAMHRALIAGHFPVRWAGNLNFSYGYPLFLFAYPLPYYLGEIFNVLGFGLVGSIKFLFVLSVFFSGAAMFFLAKEFFGFKGALIASLFYLYAPFRLVDLYVRGSLGESLAFILYPLLFWVFFKIVQSSRWVPWGAVLVGGLILVHNASALLFSPFLGAWAGFLILGASKEKRWSLIKRMGLTFLLGLGLAAFFLLPVLGEKSSVALSEERLTDIEKHLVSLSQLVKSPPRKRGFLSFELGEVHLLTFLLTFFFWLAGKKKTEGRGGVFLFSTVSLLIQVLLMLPFSLIFWQKALLFQEIDFPWRLLGPASFFLALSLGFLGTRHWGKYLAVGLVILAIKVNLGYAGPGQLVDRGDDFYLTNEATTTVSDEYMPVWVKEKPSQRPRERAEIISGEGTISNLDLNSKKTWFDLEVDEEAGVQINTVYFPGWQVTVDGKPTLIDYQNEKGLIQFIVSPGRHQVVAGFGETPLRLLADFVSLASLFGVATLVIKGKTFCV